MEKVIPRIVVFLFVPRANTNIVRSAEVECSIRYSNWLKFCWLIHIYAKQRKRCSEIYFTMLLISANKIFDKKQVKKKPPKNAATDFIQKYMNLPSRTLPKMRKINSPNRIAQFLRKSWIVPRAATTMQRRNDGSLFVPREVHWSSES